MKMKFDRDAGVSVGVKSNYRLMYFAYVQVTCKFLYVGIYKKCIKCAHNTAI